MTLGRIPVSALALLAVLVVPGVPGVAGEEGGHPGAGGRPRMPAAPVRVSPVVERDIRVGRAFVGTVEAVSSGDFMGGCSAQTDAGQPWNPSKRDRDLEDT